MKYKREPSEVIEKEEVKIETISKEPIVKEQRLCNGCKSVLPENLDRNICPYCGIRN